MFVSRQLKGSQVAAEVLKQSQKAVHKKNPGPFHKEKIRDPWKRSTKSGGLCRSTFEATELLSYYLKLHFRFHFRVQVQYQRIGTYFLHLIW